MTDAPVSRRRLLKAGAALGATAAALPIEARTIRGSVPWREGGADAPTSITPGPYLYLTPDEAAFIEAAVARLIPADEHGPGARELGCATFIDRQLAGDFGRADTWYMQGPWPKGSSTQGYQSRLDPAAYYRAAIKAIDDHCRNAFAGKSFALLGPDDQDQILSDLETGKIALAGADAAGFFTLIQQNTVEGFFADPIYGGNKDLAAWRMIGFPGARYDYRDHVGKHGERYPLPPVGLKGRGGGTKQG
jgi:gluconate 2-dehydrogenase gamma chain